ncbi:MAG: hypothetical protein EKK55_12250 [Rhodocyclaceae bacterium]|nr:MAG: hypothetical protein EKK55_12250 [Rhodocyclaceae bacterium]
MTVTETGELTDEGAALVARWAKVVARKYGDRPVSEHDLSEKERALLDRAGDLRPVLVDVLIDPSLRGGDE